MVAADQPLQLADGLRIGLQTLHRRTEPADGPWLPAIDELRALVGLLDDCGYDSLWVGDHVSFNIPFFDPLLQLAQAAAYSRRLLLGTAVYLLPLRHPALVAKQVATLDHLTEGRLVFGVGMGGEFPIEYELCGVPLAERGSRMSEAVEVMRLLWSGEPVTHAGRHFRFGAARMLPPPRQAGGPPLWFGGRSEAALARAARIGDGWLSYAVTPQQFGDSLARLQAQATTAGAAPRPFGTGHLLFIYLDDDADAAFRTANECLSVRYGTDFSKPTRRYAALGPPADVAARIREYHAAGVRHLILDFVGPYETRNRQIERFAREVRPLLGGMAWPTRPCMD